MLCHLTASPSKRSWNIPRNRWPKCQRSHWETSQSVLGPRLRGVGHWRWRWKHYSLLRFDPSSSKLEWPIWSSWSRRFPAPLEHCSPSSPNCLPRRPRCVDPRRTKPTWRRKSASSLSRGCWALPFQLPTWLRHPKNCGGKRVNEEANSSILLVPIAWMEYPKIPKQHGFYWTLHFLTPHIFNQPSPLRPNPGLWTTCRWHGHSALQPPRPWRRASPRWHRPCARHAPPRSGTGLSAPSRSHSLRSDRWNKTEDVDSLTQNWKGEGNGRGITNEIPKLVKDLQPKIGI